MVLLPKNGNDYSQPNDNLLLHDVKIDEELNIRSASVFLPHCKISFDKVFKTNHLLLTN